jgi:hypothetical protein
LLWGIRGESDNGDGEEELLGVGVSGVLESLTSVSVVVDESVMAEYMDDDDE